jgi:hypothetical protein
MVTQTEISRPAFAPYCFVCDMPALLVQICPDRPGYEQRTYKCPWCPYEMTEVRCVNELTILRMAKQHFEDWGKRGRDNR